MRFTKEEQKNVGEHHESKLLLPQIDTLEDLFEDIQMCVVVVQKKGTRVDHPPGYYFFSGLKGGRDVRRNDEGKREELVRYAKPKPEFVKTIQAHCCEGNIGAFEVINWSNDRALVIARDALGIGAPWVTIVHKPTGMREGRHG